MLRGNEHHYCLIDYFNSFVSIKQVENLLLSDQDTLKLCDFGSATTDAHYPDSSWSAIQRSLVEDEVRMLFDI